MNLVEFPHSEIPGSKDVCSSPRLIAAYHVFHRLPVPRHSPCALYSLTVSCSRFSICQQEIFTAGEIIDFNFTRDNDFFNHCKSLISQFFIQFSRYMLHKVLESLFGAFSAPPTFQGVQNFRSACDASDVFPCEKNCEASDGGLKWTRTIDLSVISRVL